MKTILVPLDGSGCAEQALPYVRLLAGLLNARVRLLHVLTDVDREGVIAGGGVPRHGGAGTVTFYSEIEPLADVALREQANIYLTAQAEPLRAAGLVVDIEVRAGIPHICIVEAADREPDTLIVISTHGYSGLRRWALGSVTDKIVRTADVPVFVVRSTPSASMVDPAIRRIIVPLDGSNLAECALPHAIALARRANAELIVMRAVALHSMYPGLLLMQRNQVAADLRTLASELRQQQVSVAPVVSIGHASPAEAIVVEAERRQVDLIVMATHGLGGVQRWIAGSVADTVLHTTTAPLLLVRGPVPEE